MRPDKRPPTPGGTPPAEGDDDVLTVAEYDEVAWFDAMVTEAYGVEDRKDFFLKPPMSEMAQACAATLAGSGRLDDRSTEALVRTIGELAVHGQDPRSPRLPYVDLGSPVDTPMPLVPAAGAKPVGVPAATPPAVDKSAGRVGSEGPSSLAHSPQPPSPVPAEESSAGRPRWVTPRPIPTNVPMASGDPPKDPRHRRTVRRSRNRRPKGTSAQGVPPSVAPPPAPTTSRSVQPVQQPLPSYAAVAATAVVAPSAPRSTPSRARPAPYKIPREVRPPPSPSPAAATATIAEVIGAPPPEGRRSVGPIRPLPRSIARACWSCGGEGHRYSQCPLGPPSLTFCRRCGRKGKTLRTCQACQGQWRRQGPYIPRAGRCVPREELKAAARAHQLQPMDTDRPGTAPPGETTAVSVPAPPAAPGSGHRRRPRRRPAKAGSTPRASA